MNKQNMPSSIELSEDVNVEKKLAQVNQTPRVRDDLDQFEMPSINVDYDEVGSPEPVSESIRRIPD